VGLTQAEYARRTGLTQSRVSYLVRDGHVVLFADGSIDAEATDRRLERLQMERTRRRQSVARQKRIVATSVSPGDPAQEADAPVGETGMTYLEAKTGNEVVRYQRAVLELRHYRGQLVSADAVERTSREIAQAVRDAWLTWPSRVAPLMAERLGVASHAMHEALSAAVRDHLVELSKEVSDGVATHALRADSTRPRSQP